MIALSVGHATDAEARTGCTVLLGPFRAACHVCGLATGTRELDALSPSHLVPQIDAILLTGGSAFGLGAADGVVEWLEAQGRGFETPAARVPIVAAAVIYDLGVGRADRRPDAAMAKVACNAAQRDETAQGRIGAGTGATVGKLMGIERAMPGGLGRAALHSGDDAILALAVVNAVGDVRDAEGRIIAGARDDDGRFVDLARALREGRLPRPTAAAPGTNTTLGVVATDAPVDRLALAAIARMASAALARRITPVFTPFDGDIVFAVATSEEVRSVSPAEVMRLGSAAVDALGEAISSAVA